MVKITKKYTIFANFPNDIDFCSFDVFLEVIATFFQFYKYADIIFCIIDITSSEVIFCYLTQCLTIVRLFQAVRILFSDIDILFLKLYTFLLFIIILGKFYICTVKNVPTDLYIYTVTVIFITDSKLTLKLVCGMLLSCSINSFSHYL